MQKIMLFSHSGFSDTDANGITMKNLLCAWCAEEKAQFYCDVQPPDFSAAHSHFRVTDVQMVKAFLGKKSQTIFGYADFAEDQATTVLATKKAPSKIPKWLKRHKYNFGLKWLREWLREVSPWGHKALREWVEKESPDVIIYMVGESHYMDRQVLRVCKQTGKPLILYHGEAFRIIDLKTRHGLERAYYHRCQKLYEKLNQRTSLVIYNCELLKEDYEKRYQALAPAVVAYNSAQSHCQPYQPKENAIQIVYFGNLGVGRSESLLKVADVLRSIDQNLILDIYGNATAENRSLFEAHPSINYHGFVDAAALREVIEDADVLIHAESFDSKIIPKLRYAFSTKIAQCLCAGRCFISFAPAQTASSQYLAQLDGPVLVSDEQSLRKVLTDVIHEPALRQQLARKSGLVGEMNHQMKRTSQRIREEILKSIL